MMVLGENDAVLKIFDAYSKQKINIGEVSKSLATIVRKKENFKRWFLASKWASGKIIEGMSNFKSYTLNRRSDVQLIFHFLFLIFYKNYLWNE